MKISKRSILAIAAALSLGAFGTTAQAQAWPTKPVTIVVPFPPGGSVDVTARLLAQKLTAEWKQSVVVDNRTGAAGTIGTAYVANAAPDGYTLLMGGLGPNALTPSAKSVPYDPIEDLTPIAAVVSQSFYLMVPSASPYKTLAELIAAAKASDELNYASAGVGSLSNFASELFNLGAGTRLQHIPYRGTAPALLGMQTGEATVYFSAGLDAVGPVKAGTLRPLLVTSTKRSSVFPEVPSLTEAGLQEPRIDSWYGIFGPGRMPEALVNQINSSVQTVLRDPDLKARLEGAEVTPGTPAAFRAVLQSDIARLTRFVKQMNFKPS